MQLINSSELFSNNLQASLRKDDNTSTKVLNASLVLKYNILQHHCAMHSIENTEMFNRLTCMMSAAMQN